MYKVEAIVKMNGAEAFVLDKFPVIKYERYGNVLIGLDEPGIFANCYSYDKPGKFWEAFAGRKFKIPMVDGSFIEASGEWWSGGEGSFSEILGSEIISVAGNCIDDLKKCYVFTGYKAVREELELLRKTYTGKVYEYREYECELTGKCFLWDKDPKNPKNIANR